MVVIYLSCSYLDTDENIRLSESDCKESKESVDIIGNIPINPDIYVTCVCIERKVDKSILELGRAKTDNIIPGSHQSIKTKLSEVVAKIMPMYQLLTLNEIPLCCVSGKTQNVNESLHSCTWRKCPKDAFESKNGTVGTALKIAHRCDHQRLSQRKQRVIE
ncbi:hypothetical protein TNCV_2347351 [Trichonephila clavipes]|nr:hypothetical protein TNCV_2347351 [Trichonephila clavipes]